MNFSVIQWSQQHKPYINNGPEILRPFISQHKEQFLHFPRSPNWSGLAGMLLKSCGGHKLWLLNLSSFSGTLSWDQWRWKALRKARKPNKWLQTIWPENGIVVKWIVIAKILVFISLISLSTLKFGSWNGYKIEDDEEMKRMRQISWQMEAGWLRYWLERLWPL